MEFFRNSKICPATNAGYTIVENTEYPDTDGTILGNVLAQNEKGGFATWEYSYFPKSNFFNGFNNGNYYDSEQKAEAFANYHTRCAKRIEHIDAAQTTRESEDYYRLFYSPDQTAEAEKFQSEKGWHKIWGSDTQGLNGDTWIVYRNVSDLPKYLQEYAVEKEVEETVGVAPFYPRDFTYARENGEAEMWRKSYQANVDCAKDIDNAISNNYNANCLDSKAVLNEVTEEYGKERVAFLIAVKVNKADWDLRYGKYVKAWAKETCAKYDEEFVEKAAVGFSSHSGLVDMVAKRIMTREQYEKHFEAANKDFISADFQCDETGGAPTSLCWNFENRNVWLEPNSSLYDIGSSDYKKAVELCADWGVRSCNDKEQLASILKRLDNEAFENNTEYFEDEYEGECNMEF